MNGNFWGYYLWIFGWIICMVSSAIVLNGTAGLLDNSIEFVYQFPPGERTEVKGVVVIIHGCTDHAGVFWPKSEACPKCDGLPITQFLTLEGLKHNFLMLAVTSHPNERFCWNEEDYPRLATLFHHFYRNILKDPYYRVPMHLLGICNGGREMGFMLQNHTALAAFHPLKFRSFALTIASVKLTPSFIAKKKKIPTPTLFVPMKRDGGIIVEIQKALPFFKSAKILIANPVPIEKDYFNALSMGYFTEEESQRLHQIFREHGFTDESNYLKKDPLSFHHLWRQMIHKYAPDLYTKDVKNYEHSIMGQLLRSAYGYHGYAAQRYREMFEFFDKHTFVQSV